MAERTDGRFVFRTRFNTKSLLHSERLFSVEQDLAEYVWGPDLDNLTGLLSAPHASVPHAVIFDNPGGGMGKSMILLPSLVQNLAQMDRETPVYRPAVCEANEMVLESSPHARSFFLVDEDNMMPTDNGSFAPIAAVLRSRAKAVLWTVPTVRTNEERISFLEGQVSLFARAGISHEVYRPVTKGVSLALSKEFLACFNMRDHAAFFDAFVAGLHVITPRMLSEIVSWIHTEDPRAWIGDMIRSQSRRILCEEDIAYAAAYFGLDEEGIRSHR